MSLKKILDLICWAMYAWLYGYGTSEENCVRPHVSASAMFRTGHPPYTSQKCYYLSPHAELYAIT